MVAKPPYEELAKRMADLERELADCKQTNMELRENEVKYRRLFLNAPIGIATVAPHGSITSANPFFCQLLGYNRQELLQLSIIDITHPEDMARERVIIKKLLANRLARVQFEKRYLKKGGGIVWTELVTSSLWDQKANESFGLGMVVDISERKLAEEERENLINELQTAISQVKALKGLLPICSYCKKIRDGNGRWNQIDAYINEHSEAEVSHSICPECARKHYPEFDVYED